MEIVVLTQELEHLEKDYHREWLYSICLELAPERTDYQSRDVFPQKCL